jgi:hypothetical protein
MILREVQRFPTDQLNKQSSESIVENNFPSPANISRIDALLAKDQEDMDDWVDGLNDDYALADDEELEEDEICAAEKPGKVVEENNAKGSYNIVMSSKVISAAQELLLCLQSSETADSIILEKYQALILTLFTSQTADAAIHHFLTPLETFFMSMALTPDGSF